MVNPADNESLYQQTLSTALGELHTLNGQIEELRTQLDRLERQKSAVESICHAIGQWVDAQEEEQYEEDNFSFSGTVGLTEEEVSLIAYPPRLPHEA
jgi:predicted  nucleic acid-binding Zn-ribbon protein